MNNIKNINFLWYLLIFITIIKNNNFIFFSFIDFNRYKLFNFIFLWKVFKFKRFGKYKNILDYL
jgi:hypothetical protein